MADHCKWRIALASPTADTTACEVYGMRRREHLGSTPAAPDRFHLPPCVLPLPFTMGHKANARHCVHDMCAPTVHALPSAIKLYPA